MKSHIFSFLLFDLFDFIFSISTLPRKNRRRGAEEKKFSLGKEGGDWILKIII
jgi:hypothetical protein